MALKVLIEIYLYLQGGYQENEAKFFTVKHGQRLRDNRPEQKQERFRSDISFGIWFIKYGKCYKGEKQYPFCEEGVTNPFNSLEKRDVQDLNK